MVTPRQTAPRHALPLILPVVTALALTAAETPQPLAAKGFSPTWIAALSPRGIATFLRGDDLRWIGMPVGGLFAGQMYLAGDGRLWCWDIFNENRFSGYHGQHYRHPQEPAATVDQGVDLILGDRVIPLDRRGFPGVEFLGQYPLATVRYRDPQVPVQVTLEAGSPFIPLDADASGMPAVVLRYTVANPTDAPITATLRGRLEHAVAPQSQSLYQGTRVWSRHQTPSATILTASATADALPAPRPDVVHEDWSGATYGTWTVTGTAFGSGPVSQQEVRRFLALGGDGDLGFTQPRLVHSHVTAPGATVEVRDRARGTLTSAPFVIDRRYLQTWVGGGKGRLEVVVDGQVVASAHGESRHRLAPATLALWRWEGRTATFRIVDDVDGPWSHVSVGPILRTDRLPAGLPAFAQAADVGTLALTLVGQPADEVRAPDPVPLEQRPVAHLGRTLTVPAHGQATVTFLVTWHFPHLSHLPKVAVQGRWYATRWADATAVAEDLATHLEDRWATTRAWRDTWYDSTLPAWFLERTFSTTSTLATSTCYRLADGRFWAWEGVGSCAGTCGHVWYYAQSLARLFPAIERDQRERVDFGLAQRADGAIGFRGENDRNPAIDAQAGYVLRTLREHQHSADGAFLHRVWPRVRLATQWLIAQDGNADGILEGPQHNTLDTDWYGANAWLSGLYQAALLAAATMADLEGDGTFAQQCRAIAARGQGRLVQDLYNGTYFQNRVDPAHLDRVNSGSGCFIDQVIAQPWATLLGLPRVFPADETRSALSALWNRNVLADVGPYRAQHMPGRWYAFAGEGGVVMCTFPRPDWSYAQASGVNAQGFQKDMAAGYFNESMNGFEHQYAAHLLWEGMVSEGLAVERLVHDRYAPAKRNPWNEIECGDHYGRSLASYGVFLAACGFRYDGPAGYLAFAPRLTPEDFRAAFTAAEGWGRYRQTRTASELIATVQVVRGQVRLRSVGLEPAAGHQPTRVTVTTAGRTVPATWSAATRTVACGEEITLREGQEVVVTLR